MPNLYIIYLFIGFTLILNVRAFIASGKYLSRKERLLYLYLFASIFGWTLSNALADIVKIPDIAIFFARVSVIFPSNILNALIQIFKEFPKTIKENQGNAFFKGVGIFTAIFTTLGLLLLNSQYNIKDFTIVKDGPADFIPGLLYYVVIFSAIIILFLILSFWKRNYKYYTRTQRVQVLSLLGSLIFIYISMTLGLIILPLQELTIYSPFMFLSLSLLLFVLNKSLWVKVALVDLQEEFLKIAGLIIVTIILVVTMSITDIINIDLDLVSKFLITFFLISIVFSINKGFEYIYKRQRKKLQADISQFIEEATTKVSVIGISTSLKETLADILETRDINLRIFNHPIDSEAEILIKKWWQLRNKTPLINREVLIESYYDKDNNREITKEIFNYFQEESIDILIPISNREDLIGLLYIRNSKKILNESDYNNLELLSNSVSVSISRALMYDEVRDLNASLKQKVSEQTQELQLKVKQLEEARRKEADMIDIMGHELRTPMSVVKLNTDLLHNFTENIEKRKEDFKKYVKRIKDAVETEIKLINTLLSSAKLEGDKIELNSEKLNITEQIKMAIHAQEGRARKKGIGIKTRFSPEAQYVFADHARTVEVLSNLIDNAVKYTQEGNVTVTTEVETDFIRISIIDTGPGMTEEDIKNLGKKFYRTSNYTQSEYSDDIDIVRPGGTGLGLYVTFSLVRKMGGEIHVESELGKGSVFTFTLPKYRGQKGNPVEGSNDMFTRLGLRE